MAAARKKILCVTSHENALYSEPGRLPIAATLRGPEYIFYGAYIAASGMRPDDHFPPLVYPCQPNPKWLYSWVC